jgi:hypothetical protein
LISSRDHWAERRIISTETDLFPARRQLFEFFACTQAVSSKKKWERRADEISSGALLLAPQGVRFARFAGTSANDPNRTQELSAERRLIKQEKPRAMPGLLVVHEKFDSELRS